jgi:succinate-acetate transporter protein
MTHAGNGHSTTGGDEHGFWREHTTISLQPVAAPSILGLYGFAASTFIVAANLAGWYGDDSLTPLILFPFALAFGGVAQFLAGMWAYRARDGLATAMHGTWGSFWIGYGIYHLLIALAVLPGPSSNANAATAFGFWFVVLAAITWVGAIAAAAENGGLTVVLGLLAAGATLLAIGLIGGMSLVETIGAYVLIASAIAAFYVASAMMLESTAKRVVLPVGKRGAPQKPGSVPRHPIQYEAGEPGVKIGQ